MASLTEREREVLQLVANGNTYKNTATKLIVEECTIVSHSVRIIQKLEAENIINAVYKACKMNIL